MNQLTSLYYRVLRCGMRGLHWALAPVRRILIPTVLVCSGCHNTVPQAGGLNSRSMFLTVLETESPPLVEAVPAESPPPGLQTSAFLLSPLWRLEVHDGGVGRFGSFGDSPLSPCPPVAVYLWLSVSSVSFHKGAHPNS